MGRHGAVLDHRQPQPVRIHRTFQQAVEGPDQQRDKAEQRDRGADLLAEPDLVVGRARRAALQGLGEPVEAVADRLMGDVLGRVGNGGRIEHPRRTLGDVAIDLARLDRALGAEEGPELRALGDVAGLLLAPHQGREFLVLGEHQRHVSWPGRGAVGGERLAGGGALQHHRLVVVGHGGRGGEHGPAAHRVALEADIVLVDDVEAAQMRQPVRAAEAVGEGGRVAIAVAGLVEGEHHIAAAGELDGKAVLGFARIDVAVNREDAGGGSLRRGVRRDVEQGAHGVALGALEADVLDLDAAGGLGQVGEQAARQDQDHAQNCQ